MPPTARLLLIILAVALFLVGLLTVLTNDAPDGQMLWGLTFGGLASFAAGHL